MRKTALLLVLLAALWVTFGRAWTLTLVVPAGLVLWRTWHTPSRGPRDFPEWMRDALLERDGASCRYCGVAVHKRHACPRGADVGCDDDYQADHVVAWANGGATTLANGVVSCAYHNQMKSDLPLEEFFELLARQAGRGR